MLSESFLKLKATTKNNKNHKFKLSGVLLLQMLHRVALKCVCNYR